MTPEQVRIIARDEMLNVIGTYAYVFALSGLIVYAIVDFFK